MASVLEPAALYAFLDTALVHEHKIVTTKQCAVKYGLSLQHAVQCLEAYWREKRSASSNGNGVFAYFHLSGIIHTGDLTMAKVVVVAEDALEHQKDTFKEGFDCYLYSLQPGKLKDVEVVGELNSEVKLPTAFSCQGISTVEKVAAAAAPLADQLNISIPTRPEKTVTASSALPTKAAPVNSTTSNVKSATENDGHAGVSALRQEPAKTPAVPAAKKPAVKRSTTASKAKPVAKKGAKSNTLATTTTTEDKPKKTTTNSLSSADLFSDEDDDDDDGERCKKDNNGMMQNGSSTTATKQQIMPGQFTVGFSDDDDADGKDDEEANDAMQADVHEMLQSSFTDDDAMVVDEEPSQDSHQQVVNKADEAKDSAAKAVKQPRMKLKKVQRQYMENGYMMTETVNEFIPASEESDVEDGAAVASSVNEEIAGSSSNKGHATLHASEAKMTPNENAMQNPAVAAPTKTSSAVNSSTGAKPAASKTAGAKAKPTSGKTQQGSILSFFSAKPKA